ncbi:hypothetical protein U9M48_041136 [Paspalum notatum var. saurae]|uniref:Uncharacterized protein n=1 Tax=Paspalum notatum var. saurae TaxID=547442 RepID=A0AAQ3UPP7_PASNO
MSTMLVLSSPKLSCMVLHRSSKTSERSSSCSTAFLCRVTWLLDDEEAVVFTLWSCSSTSVSLERGLEGTLADLRCDLERRKRAMLKDSTVALLPDVPQGVNNIAVKRPPTVLLVSSCATELFFLLTRSKRCGARLRGASPSSQLWCQNLALLPLPIVTEVEAWNNKRSMLLHGTWSPTQGFEPSIHSCHN